MLNQITRSHHLLRIYISLIVAILLTSCSYPSTTFQNQDISGATYGRQFKLLDHTGKVRQLSDFTGQAVILFFAYTQCPDVCPLTLANMAELMKILGADASRVQVLLVTLDPERDTPTLLANYVSQFHPTFLGLYGDQASTQAVAKEFRVLYQKHPGSQANNYSIDHSTQSYVFDPQGRLRLSVKYAEDPHKIAADLRLLLAGQ